jgi:hypothetical protein
MQSWEEVLQQRMSDLYQKNIQQWSIGVLILLVILAIYITWYLLDPGSRQKRRDREIRKAVAAREALLRARDEEQKEKEEQKDATS